jgi:hypothetical protein
LTFPFHLSFLKKSAVFIAVLVCALSARAQQSPLNSAAAQIADALSHSKRKTVLVFDFTGPGNRATALGQKLAGDFSASLAKSARHFRVEDRSRVADMLADYRITIATDNDAQLMPWLAQNLNAQAFVTGQLSLDGDMLVVALSSYTVDDDALIKSLQITLPLTGDMQAPLANDLLANEKLNVPPHPASGHDGYGTPVCLYCPRADYTHEAAIHKIQGVVELEAVIGEDAAIHHIKVVKPLPYGLTTRAIEALATWRLKPALGPDGKPVAVRETIEVAFQLFDSPMTSLN